MDNDFQSSKPWYHQGLRFRCSQCGQCCTGTPGYTWVSMEEIAIIANHLAMSQELFSKTYLRRVYQRYALLERPQNYDCIFLDNNKCSIYAVRPKQCRTYPWWPGNIESPEAWRITQQHCEGINEEAPIVSMEEIERQLKDFI